MAASILACGSAVTSGDWEKLRSSAGSRAHEIPATPGRSDVDPLLDEVGGGHLVVHGSDADLAAVVLRLLRTERLAVPVGYVPVDRDSPVARLWELPADPVGAALDGRAMPFPLVRDDNGGVLLGLGVLGATGGVRGTVYCDDETALRGQARRVEVHPDPELGLRVRVVRKALLRNKVGSFLGRAVQFGGEPQLPVSDGVTHPRALPRWTWYRHTDDLLVVR